MIVNIMGKQANIRTIIAIPALLLLVAVLGITGYLISKDGGDVIIGNNEKEISSNTTYTTSDTEENVANKETSKQSGGDSLNDEIMVYVTGCVKSPGIVKLKKGQIIDDAIKAAGGATADADLDNINLVYKLKENVMLRIKSKKENQAQKVPLNRNVDNNTPAGTGVEVKYDSTGVVVNGGTTAENGKTKVNINTADVAELCTIPGVGESTAKSIIEFREKNGPFENIADIMKVPGIKEGKFNRLKDYITVE